MRTLRLRVVLNTKEECYEASSSDIFPELSDIVIIKYPDKKVSTVATGKGCLGCVFYEKHLCTLKGDPIHCTSSEIGLTPIADLMEDV